MGSVRIIVAAAACALTAGAETLRVGGDKAYVTPCAAIAAARPGDVIEIDAGAYDGDVCAWSTHDLTLRGAGGRARIDAAGRNAQSKGIWVISGDRNIIENIEFSGARVPDRNGAGIRLHGNGLTVRNCYFHDNETGILGGERGHVLVEYSEFTRNGNPDGQSHNIYISHTDKFTFRFNYSHDSIVGHLVKSRAAENHILYNYLSSENGTTSYELDLPNAGRSFVIGNIIQQGAGSQNAILLAYGEEGTHPANPSTELVVAHNTFINQRAPEGTFVGVGTTVSTPAVIRANITAGSGRLTSQAEAIREANVAAASSHFADAAANNFRLTSSSPAIDAVQSPDAPPFQYLHPACGEGRVSSGPPDAGAFEFGGRMATNEASPERCRGEGGLTVLDGASFTAGPVSAGALVSIFGTGMANFSESAGSTPLPVTMAGVSIAMHGFHAPLYFVSPIQINAQIPFGLNEGPARLCLIRSGREGPSAELQIAAAAPRLFIHASSDRAIAVNHPSWNLNSAANPIPAGGVIIVYLNGIGPVRPEVPAGEAAPLASLSRSTKAVTATIGGAPADALFVGLAPGLVGVAQANLLVPRLQPGEHFLSITVDGVASNSARMSVGP